MTDMANEEKPTTDNTLKGILSKKFGNELTEDELVVMGNSLLELCELLLDNCIEQEGVKFNESDIISESFNRDAGRRILFGGTIGKIEGVLQ